MYKKLILGSPGTGKTTRLLAIAEDKLRSISPEKIAFFSFTKKAVNEASARAAKKFNLDSKRLRNFKTLHAMAYRELGLNPSTVLGYAHLKKIESITGLRLTGKNPLEEEITEKGDKFLFYESYARSVKRDIKEIWEEGLIDANWLELKLFVDTYNAYKKQNSVVDYTDMLVNYLKFCSPLMIDVAIIDEAQDLSPLQWDVVNYSTRQAKEIYIAGDDDQAIYKWSGADVEQFLSLQVNDKEVLPISRRLPTSVYEFANDIVKKISRRYEKNWQPQNKLGKVVYNSSLDKIDFSGEWFILARSNQQLKLIEEYLKQKDYLFTLKNKPSVNEEHLAFIYSYIAIQKGKEPSLSYARQFYQAGKEWYDALTNIPFYDREYYRSLLKKGIKINQIPTIHVNTIHGSKGGEADNVLLLSDLPPTVHEHFMLNSDDEHRVFYVGATRAKQELHILTPQTDYFYQY